MENDDAHILSAKDSAAVLQSAVFIEDAHNYRSIHHKIDPGALCLYRIYHSAPVKWLTNACVAGLMFLSFFEYPSSLSVSADYRYRNLTRIFPESPPCGSTEGIEGACLLLLLADALAQVHLLGRRRFLKRPWLLLYVAMVTFSLLDLVVSLGFLCNPGSLGFTLRLRRFCRPLFLLISSTIMKKLVRSLKDTLPQILTVFSLLFLHLFAFGMIGVVVFSTHSNTTAVANSSHSSPTPDNNPAYDDFVAAESSTYFPTLWTALINLLVTMTTANHPDVMIPLYQYNRFSALYFVVFLAIGNFLIFNLLTAVMYNKFKNQWMTSMQNSLFRQVVALRAAFLVLPPAGARGSSLGGGRDLAVGGGVGQRAVSKALLRRVMRDARIPSSLLPSLYSRLEPLPFTALSWREFRGVFDVLTHGNPVKGGGGEGRWRRRRMREEGRSRSRHRVLDCLQTVVQHKVFAYFTVMLVFCHVLLIAVEVSLDSSQLDNPTSRLAYYNFVFACWYVSEHVVRLVGYSPRGYIRSWTNLYSGMLSATILVLELLVLLLYGSPFGAPVGVITLHTSSLMVRSLVVLAVLRSLAVVSYVPALSQIALTLFDLLRNLRGFLGILVVAYYLFALLGMELFLDTELRLPAGTGEALRCGTFENLTYFANNFHDFASSLVTLWDVMVVNNWMVFLEAYSRAHGPWSQLYFVAWWVVSVVICLHLFVSIVLDTFLKKWQSSANPDLRREQLLQQQHAGQSLPSPLHGNDDSLAGWGMDQSMEDIQGFDVHSLHRDQLAEPQESDIMHEIVKQGDFYFT